MLRCYLLCLSVAFCAPLACAQKVEKVYRNWTKDQLVDASAVHAGRIDSKSQKYLLYFDLSAIAPDERLEELRAFGVTWNSLSRNQDIALVKPVPGTELALAYADLSLLRERDDHKSLARLRATVEKLGRVGSGPAPQPEPFYHAIKQEKDVAVEASEVVETYTEKVRKKDGYGRDYEVWDAATSTWRPEYESVTRTRKKVAAGYKKKGAKKVVLGSNLNKATVIGLVSVLETDFPIFDLRWFSANALVEPIYHELLDLDDTEASVKKLAGFNEEDAKRAQSALRGAVLFSEVAHHNRALVRSPTQNRNGRGTYQESKDYKNSVDLQDVLKDTLTDKPDAEEIIFNLPNGLLGFFVVDGDGKRLDKADGDVAANRRSKFRDTQVRTAYHCMACHYADKGWIEIDDEVRALSKKNVTLIADAFDKRSGKSTSLRGDQIRRQYLKDDFNELLRVDQALVESSVDGATTGLGSKKAGKVIANLIYDYNEKPLTTATAAREFGYPVEAVEAAMKTTGLDPVYASLGAGRKGRRDQFERAFMQVSTILYLANHKEE